MSTASMPTAAEPTAAEHAAAAPRIGMRLKDARRARRLTLDDVADTCGVTKGYLSKLERDHVNPSVATLVRVCAALDLEVGSLFDTAPAGEVVRAGALPRVAFGGEKMTEFLLTPLGERRIQVLLGELEAGGGSGAESYSLPLEVNFVHVLSGGLTIRFDGDVPGGAVPEEVVLECGDAFTFSPRRHHSFEAGDVGARVLWVLNPALPDKPSSVRG